MSGDFTMRLKDTFQFAPADVSRETFIGLGVFPIFDESYRKPLTDKIIDHYFNREIGMETISLFALAVRRRMNEYMPVANQLYKTEFSRLTDFDPMRTINIRTLMTGESEQGSTHNGNNTTATTSQSAGRTVASDTPQLMLAGNGDYATSASDANQQGSVNATNTDTATDSANANSNTDTTVSGYQGVPADIIAATRAGILNVDMMVIDQLDDCFMGIYGNGDFYTLPHNYGRLFL